MLGVAIVPKGPSEARAVSAIHFFLDPDMPLLLFGW